MFISKTKQTHKTVYLLSAILGLSLYTQDIASAGSFDPVKDRIDAGEGIEFYWTKNGELLKDAMWEVCEITLSIIPGQSNRKCYHVTGKFGPKTAPVHTTYEFYRPDVGETDWEQQITLKDGISPPRISGVLAANIVPNPNTQLFEFQELSTLPDIDWRIPDLFPINSNPFSTIYTAVNLNLYFSQNPLGFNNGNWSVGQTLDELSIEIVNGVVPGLEGIYWSTTPFVFEPSSPIGFSPTGGFSNFYNSASNKTVINNEHKHDKIPEPTSTLSLLALGTLGAGATLKRQLKPSKTTEPTGDFPFTLKIP